MSLSRLPLLRTSLARSLHTSTIRSLPAASTSTPVDSSTAAPPTSLSEPHAADAVAGKITGPITERLSAGEITAETISGSPNAMLHRQVRIYQPTKSTMQSAKGKTKRWYLDWDVLQGAGRWENPLMGWASSADYMQGTQMIFKTKEAAVAFAEKQGWDYQVSPPKKAKIPPKNYASNYTHIPGKLRIHHTK